MSCRICIFQRIIDHIRIPVQVLWIGIAWHNGIRAQESAQPRRVEPCAVVINPQPCDLALTGEELIGEHRAGGFDRLNPAGEARLAEGIEAIFTHNRAGIIRHNTRRA